MSSGRSSYLRFQLDGTQLLIIVANHLLLLLRDAIRIQLLDNVVLAPLHTSSIEGIGRIFPSVSFRTSRCT